MQANLSVAHRYQIPARSRLVSCALALAAIVTVNPAGYAQPRGTVHRSNLAEKKLGVLDVRTRIATDDGAFIIYDAPRAEAEPPARAGYLAYWYDFAADEVFVYGRVIKRRSDLVHALLSLRHDFGIDPHDLAPNVFTDDLPHAADVDSTDPAAPRVWYKATRARVMVIVGLWQAEDVDAAGETTAGEIPVGPPCRPCAAAAGGVAGTVAPLTGDEYFDGVMAVCACCGGPECPNCEDGSRCTSDWCEVECNTAYCVHRWRNCDDGNQCTSDSCNPSTGGCVHLPKNCDDGLVCTADSCNPSTGACENPQRTCNDGNPCTNDSCNPSTGLCVNQPKNCDDDEVCTYDRCNSTTGACYYTPRCVYSDYPNCCPNGTSYFCCAVGEDVCCPTNPAYADHCCLPDQTCCGAGCCDPDQNEECCDGECCGAEEVCCPGVVAGGGPMCVLAGCSFSIGPLSACAGTSVTMELTGSCGPECESITFETIKSHQYLTINPPGGSSCADSPFTRNFTVDISADAPGGAHFFELVGTLGTGATCSGAGQVTVFAIPTGEISTCLGWESNPAMDVATFSGTLTPPTADFSGRTVTEDPVGSGTGTTDSCWFQGSAFVQYTDANSIAGGTWTVGANNTWQTDHIGINGNIDAYYSAQGRTPCAWHTVQHMKIVCPSGNQEYTTNSFDWSITANGTTISRGGVPCTPPH